MNAIDSQIHRSHHFNTQSLRFIMLFKFSALAGILSAATAVTVSSQLSAADMASNLDRLTTLTRVTTAIYQYVVFVNNPPTSRLDVIGAITATKTQATLDQDLMNGQACGSLTRRFSGDKAVRSGLYTVAEQANVTAAYTTVSNFRFLALSFT